MKHTKCLNKMKLREISWETEPTLRAGLSCSVRARPLEGLAGRHSPAFELTRTKHTDCPRNPAHLSPEFLALELFCWQHPECSRIGTGG
jgi:hypothetical protein